MAVDKTRDMRLYGHQGPGLRTLFLPASSQIVRNGPHESKRSFKAALRGEPFLLCLGVYWIPWVLERSSDYNEQQDARVVSKCDKQTADIDAFIFWSIRLEKWNWGKLFHLRNIIKSIVLRIFYIFLHIVRILWIIHLQISCNCIRTRSLNCERLCNSILL